MPDLAPAAQIELSTRSRLQKSDIRTGSVVLSGRGGETLVTRRYAQVQKRRKKKILTAVAVVIGLFPPVWAVYLVTWLIWRSRKPQKSMRLVKKGITSLDKGETGVALKRLQDAHFLNPQNTDALYWLGLLLSRQGRHEEAQEALEIVSRRVPGLPEVEEALVDAHLALDQPEAAVHHGQRLFDAAPHSVISMMKLAEAFEADGRPELAVEILRQAPIHKRVLTPELVEVHYRLGRLAEKTERTEEAREHYRRVVGKDIQFKDAKERLDALDE